MPAEVVDASLDLQMASDAVIGPTTTYGGADARIGTSFVCTTGFTVTKNGTTGVSTDGHCGSGLNSYRDFHTGITHSMTYQSGYQATWGDFEWLTTSGTEVDDFYVNDLGTLRDVSGIDNPALGTPFSYYGRASRASWPQTVAYTNVVTSGPEHLNCGSEYHVIGGDSGGPVYNGTLAEGLVYGWIVLDGFKRDCWSQARYIDDAIGVSIKTS
jgi:hypothetical protein